MKYRKKSKAFYALQFSEKTTLEEVRKFLDINENSKDCFIDRAGRLVIIDDSLDNIFRLELGEWLSWTVEPNTGRVEINRLRHHGKLAFSEEYEKVEKG